MTSDPFTAYALERQPSGLDGVLVLFDEKTRGPDASSPHIVTRAWIGEHLGWTDHRQRLLACFDTFLEQAQQHGIIIEGVLIGGSFVSRKDSPKDIDFLVIYRADENFEAAALSRFVSAKQPYLDWRFVPSDTGTLPLLKITLFCHLLYEGRSGGEGSILMIM